MLPQRCRRWGRTRAIRWAPWANRPAKRMFPPFAVMSRVLGGGLRGMHARVSRWSGRRFYEAAPPCAGRVREPVSLPAVSESVSPAVTRRRCASLEPALPGPCPGFHRTHGLLLLLISHVALSSEKGSWLMCPCCCVGAPLRSLLSAPSRFEAQRCSRARHAVVEARLATPGTLCMKGCWHGL